VGALSGVGYGKPTDKDNRCKKKERGVLILARIEVTAENLAWVSYIDKYG